jgi:hypothetical protein
VGTGRTGERYPLQYPGLSQHHQLGGGYRDQPTHHLAAPRDRPRGWPCCSTRWPAWRLSNAERASLAWLAGFEVCAVDNIAAVIICARQTWASCLYRALIGSVLNADVLLAGRRFGGQPAGVAGGDAVGAPRCCGGVEYVVETGFTGVTFTGVTELVG